MTRTIAIIALLLLAFGQTGWAWQFETLETRGSAYERGLQHGQRFKEQINRDFDVKGGWGYATNPIHLRHRVLRHLITPLLNWPNGRELLEEMQGIADGAGRTFEEIAAFNLTWDHNERAACSMALLPNGADGPILINTLDDFTSGKSRQNYPLFVQVIHPTSGHAMVTLCNYGTVWAHQGMNAAGLAMGSTSGGLGAPRGGSNYDGVYYGLLTRYALQNYDTAQQAIDLYSANLHTSKGINISVLDRAGDGAMFEFSSSAIGIRRIEDRQPLCATNFFQTDKYPPYSAETERYPYMINARARYVRAQSLFVTYPTPSIADANAMITDINGGIEGQICQDNNVMYTVEAMVFDCATATAHVYLTHPTDAPPIAVVLKDADNPTEGQAAGESDALRAILAAEPEKPAIRYHRMTGVKITGIENDGMTLICDQGGKTFRAELAGANIVPHVPLARDATPEEVRVDFHGKVVDDGKRFLADRVETYTPSMPWKEQSNTSSLRREADGNWTIVYGDDRTIPVTLTEDCKVYMRYKGRPNDVSIGDIVDMYGQTVISDQNIGVTWLLTYPDESKAMELAKRFAP